MRPLIAPVPVMNLFWLSLLAAGCGGRPAPSSESDRESRYQRWFLDIPHSEELLFAAGYSRVYANIGTSIEEAKENVAVNLATGSRVQRKENGSHA